MDDCDCANELLKLRRELVWDKQPVREFFHATEDKQAVRDRVFEVLAKHDFRVQATVMEKSKAQPQVTATEERFYKTGWFFHFRNALAKYAGPEDELLITTASIGTRRGQKVFTDAVNDVIQQNLPRKQWATSFCQSMADPCLQLADYCTWAIQRKWERDDDRSYKLIADRITYEYDLWKAGTKHHY